jgi:hypothetical protein
MTTKIEELQALVDKIQQFRQMAPEQQRQARIAVWMARVSMAFALAVLAFNAAMLDVPPLTMISTIACTACLVQGFHALMTADTWRAKLQAMVDDSAADLRRATALLEYARAQNPDERPAGKP